MNRLIFAIMFAIALALSFVRVTGSNMSMTDDFQPEQSKTNWTEPSTWLSKVVHIFGEYKPVAGTVTLADTTSTVKPKTKKQQIVNTPQPAANTANTPVLPNSISRDGFDVSAVINADSTDSTKAVAEITLTNPGTLNEPGCATCKVVFDESISSDVTKQASQVNDLMNKVLLQAKNAKDTGNIVLGDNDDSGRHKKKKNDDDVDDPDDQKHDAQVAVDTCKAKKVVQYKKDSKDHDAGDWGTKGDYKNDPDGYNRCLQAKAKKFKSCMENSAKDDACSSIDGLDGDTVAEVAHKLSTALPQAFQACLAAGDSCDRDAWSKWQEDNPAQAMIAWNDYITKQYPSQATINSQVGYMAKLGPQGLQAAYNLVAGTAQRLTNSEAFANDVNGYNAMRASYADNKPDSDDPHAMLANSIYSSSVQISSPTSLSNYTSLMGNIQQAALKQGYDVTTQQQVVGQTQSALAGSSGLSPQVIQAVQAAGMKIVVCDTANGILDGRGCTDRGNSLYGTGALAGLTPNSDPTNIGLAAFRLGQQNAALNTGLNAGLVNGTSIPAPSTQGLPWASNNGLSTTPNVLQQNTLNMNTGRVSGLRQVGS